MRTQVKNFFNFLETEKLAEFQLNLLSLDLQSLGVPDTDYQTKITMASNEFVVLCRDFSQLSESVKISVEGKSAVFSINGKSGGGKVTLKSNNAEKVEDAITIETAEKVECSYGLQYLNSFAKASALSGQVTLNISEKYPLMIDYEIEGMGYIKYYLAPKMDDETNE